MKALAACLLLAWAALARAGNQDKLYIDDDAALSGGAVTALGRSAGMGWYNPAGLAFIDRPTVKIGASAYTARFIRIPKLVDVTLEDGRGSVDFSGSSFFSTPSSLVYAYRIRPGLALSLNVFTNDQFDYRESQSRVFSGYSQAHGQAYVYEQGAELDIRSKNYQIGPALGLALGSLRLGMGAFAEYGKIGFATRFFSDYYLPGTLNGSGFYDYRIHSRTDQYIAAEQYALRGTAGLQYDLPGGLSFGAAFHSPRFTGYVQQSADVVLDGETNSPTAIIVVYHVNGDAVSHPYVWEQPWRALFGLGKRWDNGSWLALEADISDYPAERGSGALWNQRLGGLWQFKPRWALGAGVYTDFARKGKLDAFAQSNIDFYGGSLGIKYVSELSARVPGERDGDDPQAASKAARPLLMATTLGFRFEQGRGEFAGVGTYGGTIVFPYPIRISPISVDDASVYLSSGLDF